MIRLLKTSIKNALLLIFLCCTMVVDALEVSHLRVESLLNPQGIDTPKPRFSWLLQSEERNVVQTSYRIVLTADPERSNLVWDSGSINSNASVDVMPRGLDLKPSTRYYWYVTIRDNKGNEATSSETAYFDTGLMSSDPNPLSPAIWLQSSAGNTSESASHYAVDFDMYLVKASAAIIFAATSDRDYCMWQINCYNYDSPTLRRHVYVNGSSTTTNKTIPNYEKKDILGHMHHYRIEVEDKEIRTFIDGNLIDSYTNTVGSTLMGDIGMRVHGSTGEEALFDNLVLTAYDYEGNATMKLSEDFESPTSETFPDAVVTTFSGSQMCYMQASSEKKLMQAQSYSAPMFRKEFTLKKSIRSAKLYTSGLGVYDVFVNGKRVGHLQPDGTTIYEEMKPGWTDYRTRVFYSSHDITSLLAKGNNAIGAVVTSGWWIGDITRGAYGKNQQPGFIAKLLVTYEDGSEETFVSDLSWKTARNGAMKMGDIYHGETYDARYESAWTTADYNDNEWAAATQNTSFSGRIDAFTGGYVLQLADKVQSVKTATIYEGKKETGTDYGMINIVETHSNDHFILRKGQAVILDFGQNIVGWPRFKVRGKAGNRLHLRFSEMLNDDGSKSRSNDGPGGSLYLANLRTAKAQLFYTLSGKDEGETYQPSMTFFGFRYCEIRPTDDVEVISIVAQPISSSTDESGTITTSDPKVNQLFSNIQWGQRGNLLSVPTDCPQRNERLGWTADTHIFLQTGMFNADTESFYRKWMQDMRDSQNENGAFPCVAPQVNSRYGQGAWSDAGIIVPWKLYLMYGNKEILRENYASMERYMSWLATQTGDGYKYQGGGTSYGDWLSYVETDKRYVSVAYYALDAQLMAKMSRILSADDNSYAVKAESYETLFQNIKNEFHSRYFTPNLTENSQTAMLLALQFNLLESREALTVKTRLAQALRNNNYTLNTGFVGTGIINPTLSRFGLTDYAYDLLLQRQCPSWLYSVDQGATTIWERWNSYTIDDGFGDASMNSFNHYAYGAVGEWMYRYMVGIEADEDKPGFEHFILQPHPDRRTYLPRGQTLITSAEGTYRSRYGMIHSAWKASDKNSLTYDCTVPPNSTATLYLPAANKDIVVLESGKSCEEVKGVAYTGYNNGCHIYELGSGTYHFTIDGSTDIKSTPYNPKQTFRPSKDGETANYVFDLGGRLLLHEINATSELSRGIYVTGGKKIVIQ